MEITILGSGTGVPSVRRASPCILAASQDTRLLVDTGPGALRQLVKAGASLNDIDLIIYTHFHIDHTADMIPFLFASKYGPGRQRTRDLTLLGPPGLKKLYDGLCSVYGRWAAPEHFSLEWIEIRDETVRFKDLTVQALPVNHIESSIAVRLTCPRGKTVVFSGDTDYCPEIVRLSQNADMAVLECSFPEGMKCAGHLTPSLAGRIAREARCKKLTLTHFYPPCDSADIPAQAATEFSGEIVIAEDLMRVSL